MTEEQYNERLESLAESFGRASRWIAKWHDFASGKSKIRPTTELRHLFRSGSIIVKDTLGLLTNVAADKDAKREAKIRIKAIGNMIKPVISSLDGFITVPVVKVTADVDSVRRLFDLIHQRLTEEIVEVECDGELEIPRFAGNHKQYKIAVKKFAHRLSLILQECDKLPTVCGYPAARDYIVMCTRGNLYYKHCKVIQDAMDAYKWKPGSLLTYCKGGSTYDKKVNDKRQTKISKKKRKVSKSLKGAWHDAVP